MPSKQQNFKVRAVISTRESYTPGSVMVDFYWDEPKVDRPHTFGIACGSRANADRIIAAANAGALFEDMEVKTGHNGKTYVSAKCKVMGRYLNADLKRLGF